VTLGRDVWATGYDWRTRHDFRWRQFVLGSGSVGTLIVSNSLTLGAGSVLGFELGTNSDRVVVVHGDYRTGNYIHEQGRIKAILDWEMVHLGDPMDDISYIIGTAWRSPTSRRSSARRSTISSPRNWLRSTRDDRAVIESGEPLIDREEPITHRDGRQFWVSTTKTPLRDAQGKVIGLVGRGREITQKGLRASRPQGAQASPDMPPASPIHRYRKPMQRLSRRAL
jgi:hypothetical protein